MALFSLMSSLFAAVVGRHYQVAVRCQVLDVGGLAADGGHLALHPRDLEHAAWVMFQQVALKGLPASTNAHHHVLVVQHSYEKHFLPNTVSTLRLPLYTEFIRAPAGGIVSNMSYGIIQQLPCTFLAGTVGGSLGGSRGGGRRWGRR